MCRRPMYHVSVTSAGRRPRRESERSGSGAPKSGAVSMRPKKSPAPGLRRSFSASHTVISMYSLVISSAELSGSTCSSRSIIRSRERRANVSRSRSASSSGNGFTGASGPAATFIGGNDASAGAAGPRLGFVKSSIEIRDATVDDAAVLWHVLNYAGGDPDVMRSADELRADPALARYVDGWGRSGDAGAIAIE